MSLAQLGQRSLQLLLETIILLEWGGGGRGKFVPLSQPSGSQQPR